MVDLADKIFLQKRVEKLKKSLKNKRILAYGTGKFFAVAHKYCNLSELNIIGVVDRKYELDSSLKEDYGYRVVRLSEIYKQDFDCILICLEKPMLVMNGLKSFYKNAKIISLNKISPFAKLAKMLGFKPNGIKNQKNFVLIKQDGTKIYNPKIKNLTIKMWGDNSKIEIYEPFRVGRRCHISCGDNSTVRIRSFNRYGSVGIYMGSNNLLDIGEHTTMGRVNLLLRCSKNVKMVIGKDCMFSYDVLIRTTDGHAIYDVNTKALQNEPKDVIIGNHVWIGAKAMLLKGSNIPSNSVIGAYSLVNKKFTQENTVIAGNPAKVVKTGVNWDRRTPYDYSNKNIE